jgi:hypothetical protein
VFNGAERVIILFDFREMGYVLRVRSCGERDNCNGL